MTHARGCESIEEDLMRKLCLTLAAGVAVLSTGALPTNAAGIVAGGMLRPAIEDVSLVEPVRYVCTHFWNGRWHHREICVWVPGHHGHRHHHR
jgi:hypothetical protein